MKAIRVPGRSVADNAGQSMLMVAATASFTACSMGMMVFNKLAIRAFPLACTLVAAQMAFTVLIMVTFCWRSLHIGSIMDALKWCRVVPFFIGMLLTSMFALRDAPMSLVITFRALSPILTLMVEGFMPKPPKVGFGSFCCLLTMCIGASFYAAGLGGPNENASSWVAIGWIALNTALACTERLLQRMMLSKEQVPVDVSKTAASLLNNLFGMMPLIAAAFLLGEAREISSAIAKMSRLDYLWLALSCVVGVGISFTAIWTQSVISATSMLVLTNANKFVVIVLELYVMPETRSISPTQMAGAVTAILATVFYARCRESEELVAKEMEKGREKEQLKARLGEKQPLLPKNV